MSERTLSRFPRRGLSFLLVLAVVPGLVPTGGPGGSTDAWAGPNEAGRLVIHATSLVYTDGGGFMGQSGVACGQDGPEGAPACPPYDPVGGGDGCNSYAADPTSAAPVGQPFVWFVLAAFDPPTCPRLKAVSFRIVYDESQLGIFDQGTDEAGTFVVELPSSEDGRPWPAPKSGIGVSWEPTRTSQLQEICWFASYAYGPGWLELDVRSATDHSFVDDSVPSAEDPIAGLGVLGFGGNTGCNPVECCCCSSKSADPCWSPTLGTTWGRLKTIYRE